MTRLLSCVFLAALVCPSMVLSQLVCLGKNGKPGTDKDLDEKVCQQEKAPANLFIARPVRLTGTFLDQTGVPLNFDSIRPDRHSIVQIKNPHSNRVLYAVPLRANGEFEFEIIPAGAYRIIIVWMKDEEFSRLPLADQPGELRCSEDKECRVNAIIRFHGTDNPIDFCPPK